MNEFYCYKCGQFYSAQYDYYICTCGEVLFKNIYLCVSVGLPYKDGYCYKFLASIIKTN